MTLILLLADISLAILYALLPLDMTLARQLLAMMQFLCMAGTMLCAAGWVLEDF